MNCGHLKDSFASTCNTLCINFAYSKTVVGRRDAASRGTTSSLNRLVLGYLVPPPFENKNEVFGGAYHSRMEERIVSAIQGAQSLIRCEERHEWKRVRVVPAEDRTQVYNNAALPPILPVHIQKC